MDRYKPVGIELAYLAGFFDGEGCISVSPYKASHGNVGYQLIVAVSQNDGRALEPFARRWGGKINVASGHLYDRTCGWSVGSNRALRCLADLRPYLRAKQEEAVIALTWPATEIRGRGHVLAAEVFNQRREIWCRLKEIKRARKVMIPPDSQPGVDKIASEPGLLGRPHVIRALELYKSGQTSDEVARELNLLSGSVTHWVRQAGISRRRGTRTFNQQGELS